MRWRIAILISAAIAISYLDRQTLPVAVKAISRDIPLTNEQFSTLQSAFLFAYAFMYAGGGKLVDLLGTRLGLTVIMLFWSFACASHALATGFRYVGNQQISARYGGRWWFPCCHSCSRGMVSSQRTCHGDGHRQCRDGGGSSRCPSSDRGRSWFRELALDLRAHRWTGSALACLVEVVLFPSDRDFR